MRLKSKSSIQIKKTDIENPQVKISKKQLEELYEKEGKLEILEDKVSRSKPILETIYEKIKRKENYHQQQVQVLQAKVQHNNNALREYKQLYEQSVRLLERNNVVQRYKGYSNYLPKQDTQQEEPKFEENVKENHFDWRRLKDVNKENGTMPKYWRIQDIKKNYNINGNPLTKEHIYQIYKRKLGEPLEESMLLEEPTKFTAKSRSKQLLSEFDRDLQKLNNFRPRGKSEKQSIQSSHPLDQHKLKQKFLKLQQQKLLKI